MSGWLEVFALLLISGLLGLMFDIVEIFFNSLNHSLTPSKALQ